MTANRVQNRGIEKPVKQRTAISRILKYFFVGIGSVLLLLIAFVLWIYLALFSGPGPMEINDFHPFRSEQAKAQYLAFENQMAKSWPMRSEEKLVETSYGKTFIRVSGPAGAPPLVLLPGGGCNSLSWHANIQALSQKYRTYALDNIYDYGRSVYTREIKDGRDFSDWLDELFDALWLCGKIRIIGYSYGGWVTSQYALHHPERLARVVLIAPVYTVLPLSDKYVLDMIATLIPVRRFKSKLIYSTWFDLAQRGESGRQLVEDRIDYYTTALKCFKFKQPARITVLTDSELKKIRVPVLFLVGDHETIYDAHDAVDRLHRVNPTIRTEIIPGTGHDLMFTHTEIVNRKILDFLREKGKKGL